MTWKEWLHKKYHHLLDLLQWRIVRRSIPIESQERGRWGEWRAGQFLRKKKFRLLLQNVRMPCGEIDWVAVDQETLVFVEVKTRDADSTAHPIFAIDWKKRKRLRRAARVYLHSLDLQSPTFRFDAVEVLIFADQQWECRWTPRLEI
ncbi:MAG: YraN family protein [Verrucomicrobiota bacterium]